MINVFDFFICINVKCVCGGETKRKVGRCRKRYKGCKGKKKEKIKKKINIDCNQERKGKILKLWPRCYLLFKPWWRQQWQYILKIYSNIYKYIYIYTYIYSTPLTFSNWRFISKLNSSLNLKFSIWQLLNLIYIRWGNVLHTCTRNKTEN